MRYSLSVLLAGAVLACSSAAARAADVTEAGPPIVLPEAAVQAGVTASAQLTEKQLEKLWGKYAVPFFAKPKMGCVCFDGVNNFRLGSIVQYDSTHAACYFTSFAPDGTPTSQGPCNGAFAPLTK